LNFSIIGNIETLLVLTFFVYFGATIPWSLISQISLGRLFGLAIFILILRRLPFVIMFYRCTPAIKTLREAIFAGWFGPMGAGAIFYAMVALMEDLEHGEEILIPIIYFMVLVSVMIHGITIPLTKIGIHVGRTLTANSGTSRWIPTSHITVDVGNSGLPVSMIPFETPNDIRFHENGHSHESSNQKNTIKDLAYHSSPPPNDFSDQFDSNNNNNNDNNDNDNSNSNNDNDSSLKDICTTYIELDILHEHPKSHHENDA